MARAVWKGPFVEESLMKKVDKYKDDPKKIPVVRSILWPFLSVIIAFLYPDTFTFLPLVILVLFWYCNWYKFFSIIYLEANSNKVR